MPYKKIMRLYNERKGRLASLLNESNVRLRSERIYAIQGAIDEIDLFLRVLGQYQHELSIAQQQNPINRLASLRQ
ncbi:hypothetical protein JXB31_01390 [Candidatus Woesearchaeota archaeon]|nr:hypothetical protein [Candidatus Woesearchaeota archaeon]